MSHSSDHTSHTMLDGLRRSDSASWRRFVDVYGPLVYSWCRRRGVLEDQASDVLQEILQRVAVSIPRFRKQRPNDTFRGWLRTISRNCIHDFFRQQQKAATAVGGTDMQIQFNELPDGCEESEERAEVALITRRALELVRTDYQPDTVRAFELTVLEGHTPTEAAQILGMQPPAVRQAKFRILQRLREELSELEELL